MQEKNKDFIVIKKNKLALIITIFTLLVIIMFFFVYNYYNKDIYGFKNGYPINEQGQTYGELKWENDSMPDLILISGSSKPKGYILTEDLTKNDFKSPEEALKWQAESKNELRYIPVYLNDGKTIIGEYAIGNTDEPYKIFSETVKKSL